MRASTTREGSGGGRAWLEAKDVLSALPVEELRRRLHMLNWDRIVCAVDFSEPSRLAMQAAADLACRYGSHLTLVHVHEATVANPEVLLAPPELFEASARESEQKLEQWRSEAQHLAGRTVKTLLLKGPAALEIVRPAEDDRSDLIVIATRGRTGLKRVVLGSVAEHVVRMAPCPVFVVRGVREPESR